MSKIKTMKLVMAATLGTCSASSFPVDKYDMAWFKNESMCGDMKVTIKSYCRIEPNEPINSICTQQTLVLERSGAKKITRDLLEKEPSRGYFHVVSATRCVAGDARKYLYLSLDNGGNCSGCESQAIMDLNGNWRLYGDRWYAHPIERKEIRRHRNSWFKQESILLENKVKD